MNRRQRNKQIARRAERIYRAINAWHHRPQNAQHRFYLNRKYEHRRRLMLVHCAGIGVVVWLKHLFYKYRDELPTT